jgi:hypothetical protein
MSRFVGWALVASMLGAVPALAQPMSQDLTIDDYAHEAHSGLSSPATLVLETETEFRTFMATTSLPPPIQPRIDFGTEDVLVAAMGTKPTSGYSIEIVKATLMTGGFTGGHCFVEVRETAPTGMALMVLTSPIHIVVVPKGAIAYHFNTTSGAPFTTLDLTVHSPLTQATERVVVQGNGRAELFRSSPTARYAPVGGVASTTELSAVIAAFNAARVDTLPSSIPDPNTYIVAPDVMGLASTVGTTTYNTEASLGVYGSYDARLRPLVAALRAIAARLISGGTFEQLTVRYSGGLAPWSDEYTIADDGTVTIVRRTFFSPNHQYWNGTATPAQLQALKDAVQAADVASLPASIDDPVLVMDVPSVTYTTTLSGQDHTTTVVKAGFYDTYEARLRPLAEAVQAIVEPILNPPALTITGLVRRSAGGYLYIAGRYVPWSDGLSNVLSKAVGRNATVKAYARGQGTRSYLQLESVMGTTTANLNMRVDPRLGASVVRVIPRGRRVEITGRSPDRAWYMVVFGSDAGWSSASYIRVGN